MKYRLYIDEVGNSDLGSSFDPNHRYLSLTGVAFELGYVDVLVSPRLETLKRRYFPYHADDPIILHRKEILARKPPFEALRDSRQEKTFRLEVLQLLEELVFVVFTVVIDKLEHHKQYQIWRYDPYHYCLEILMERFVLWLESKEGRGDLLAESRGGKEDRRLKDSFRRHVESGTKYLQKERILERLTSGELKIKNKANNIAGLQICDLVAHPSFKATLARKQNQALAENFGGEIAKILETDKYYRDVKGHIWGGGENGCHKKPQLADRRIGVKGNAFHLQITGLT